MDLRLAPAATAVLATAVLATAVLVALTLFAHATSAQTLAVTPDPAPAVRYKYAELIGVPRLLRDFGVRIDSGQVVEVGSGRGQPTDGTELYPYESFAAALNDIRDAGWTLVETYRVGTDETLFSIRWVIRRPE